MEMSQGNSCIAVLNKKNIILFIKTENRRAERILFKVLRPVGGKRMGERVKESEYNAI
jgi:hypothetical protein